MWLGAKLGASTKLQWVHGLLTVGDSAPAANSQASGWRLQWVHGLLTVGDYTFAAQFDMAVSGFNGSTAF